MLRPSCRRGSSPVACSFWGRKNVFTQSGSFATGRGNSKSSHVRTVWLQVRVLPGPPAFARFASYGQASLCHEHSAKRAKAVAPKPAGRRRTGASLSLPTKISKTTPCTVELAIAGSFGGEAAAFDTSGKSVARIYRPAWSWSPWPPSQGFTSDRATAFPLGRRIGDPVAPNSRTAICASIVELPINGRPFSALCPPSDIADEIFQQSGAMVSAKPAATRHRSSSIDEVMSQND